MEIYESGMIFSFQDGIEAVKYDDHPFYSQHYNHIDGGKGVDILAAGDSSVLFIEVKNCTGTAENQDKWRRQYSGTKNMDTLASEIAGKVAHTCACLTGAATYGERNKTGQELMPYLSHQNISQIASLKKKLYVLLYLEGDFSCFTRPNKTIYGEIRKRIAKRLDWLNCKVDVVSTETQKLPSVAARIQE